MNPADALQAQVVEDTKSIGCLVFAFIFLVCVLGGVWFWFDTNSHWRVVRVCHDNPHTKLLHNSKTGEYALQGDWTGRDIIERDAPMTSICNN